MLLPLKNSEAPLLPQTLQHPKKVGADGPLPLTCQTELKRNIIVNIQNFRLPYQIKRISKCKDFTAEYHKKYNHATPDV